MKLLLVADLSLRSDANCAAASSEANANAPPPTLLRVDPRAPCGTTAPCAPVFGSLPPREAAIQIRHESPTMDARPL